ncbi:MAG: ERF family protein, partial [Terricaulis sp.]
AVLEMARPILNECGLVLTQPPYIEGDTLMVRTAVVHKATGEMHECSYPAGLLTLQHQQLGAGVTYARRYSLLSILGVFPENEDDDGEKAGAAGGERHPSRDPQPRQQQTNASQAKKAEVWPRFVEKLRSFTDLDELERWWSSASTQAAVDAMPGQWPEQAHEEYEKRQEALASAGAP